MSDNNNNFLSGYNKTSRQGSSSPGSSKDNGAESIKVKDARLSSMKYEEKSGFIKPPKKETSSSSGGAGVPKNLMWIIIGVLAIAGVTIALILIFSGGGAVMKNFEDWEIGDVQLWANENNVKLQIDEQYSDTFEEGRVISQSVAEGTKVKKGEFIGITVSMGHDLSVTLPLPDLLSMTKDEVEAWAEENYMTKVRITTEFSDDVPVGYVIRYEINDDTVVDEVRRDTPVYVIVSKGMEDETAADITVPDFKTMALSESFVFATDNGIELVIEERYDDYVPKGSVISQSVKPEEKVKKGDKITLVVSKGKEIIVPDFSGYSKERAQSVAAELGIPISIRERYSGSSAGRFLSQSIPAGTTLEEGDYLELCYSVGNEIVVSSFVGQTRDAIEAWANGLNELDARITIKITYTVNSAPVGTIISQDIANKVISRGTTIRITVSKGSVVFVPDFVTTPGLPYGQAITRETAIKMCEEAGIIPVFTEGASSGRLPGEIWYQSIAAGTEVYEGSTITLKYTPPAQTSVPDFSGMTKQEVLDAGYDMKFLITFVQSEEVVIGFEDKVYEQSVPVGTTVATGSEITLTISGDAVPTPTVAPTPSPIPAATP